MHIMASTYYIYIIYIMDYVLGGSEERWKKILITSYSTSTTLSLSPHTRDTALSPLRYSISINQKFIYHGIGTLGKYLHHVLLNSIGVHAFAY